MSGSGTDRSANAYGAYEAVVFDLDGTLVRLVVDWDAVAAEVTEALATHDVDADGRDLWGLLDLADETGLRAEVEAIVGERERAGARRSERLPTADDLAALDRPAAVCSLNAESAARAALATHDLADRVDAVVGRDSVSARKPDPEPLLAALRALDVSPDRALFVGDSARDAEAADRAGVAFRYVGDGPSGY
ncbi:MAG: HAD family hydrolase [Haloferacaceae archaeon]